MLLDKIEQFIAALSGQQTSELKRVILGGWLAGKEKLMKHYNKCNWMYCAIVDPRHKMGTFDMVYPGEKK